jgi:large subunit ribosomal protein L25
MAEVMTLDAEVRTVHGTQNAKRIRRGDVRKNVPPKVPGVIYGHKEKVISLNVNSEDLWRIVRHNARVVDLKLDGKTEKCLIKELQWDALGKEILHVDFNRVSVDERIRVTVPLQLRGTAPGVNAGGVLNQGLHTLDIECLAIAVPDAIRVNVHELQLDQAIHVRELHPPEGVKVLSDPEAIVVQCAKPLEEAPAPVAGAPPAVEGPAEPEVIGRKVAEEKEEEAEK